MDTKREHRTHAEGSPRGNPYDLSYSPSGRLIGKFRENNSVTLSATVDMAYGYCDDYQPHAVKRMFNYKNGMLYDMRWDEAGNLGQVSMAKPGEMFEAGRFLFWTEDNRMHTAVDDKHYSYYAYDYGGERRLKLTGKNDLLDVNADFMATYTILNEPTLYPSAYMVLTNRGYTNVAKAESRTSLLALPRRSSVTVRKHYYAGTERVAARLGGGGLDALYHAIGNDEELQVKADMLFKQSLDQVNNRVLQENDLDCIMHNDFAKEEFGHWIDGIPYRMQTGVEPNHDQFKYMMNSMLFDFSQGDEPDVYFYHSDHLGSASWITDFSGMAVQHIQYLPYGEPYINQHPFGYSERFRFTGKERDEETGYGYFGARYMDHELMTMWLSVDPMADKYPSISPYAYCAWNPVKLVDPDGREFGKTYDKITGDLIHDDHINDGKVYLGTKRDGSDREYLTQEHCIKDMSAAFDKQLEETRDFFQKSAKTYDKKSSSDMFTYFTNKAHKIVNFRNLVTDGADFDLKANGVFSESNLSENGGEGYAFYHGKLLRYDDFGNYNYGVAAKAYGLPEFVATAGAGVNQLVKGIQGKTPVFLNNVRGLGDDPRDTEMIHQGYNHKF